MIRHRLLLAIVAATAATTNNAIANSDPYLERNGRLVVEVEAGTATGDWSFENTIDGHTGSGYLVWKGTNNYARSEAPRGNPIQYHIRIENPGNYELRWRSRNTVGLEATEHNDSWVRFPSGRNIEGQHFLDGWTKAYMGQVAQWTWDAYTVDNDNKSIRQYFDAGDHLVEVSGRSNGHGLDRFALFRYEQETFDVSLFDALSPSLRASEDALAGHTFTGHSCIGNQLSLAAESAVVYSDTDSDIAGNRIRMDSSLDSALLRFNVPQLQAVQASIKLANNKPDTRLSAYLGSHNDWSTLTPAQELPYASLLLGTYESDNMQNQIQSLSIDPGMVTSGPFTVILRSESGTPHTLYGIASALEPRLDILVPDTFCANYQAMKTGVQPTDSPDRDTFVDDNSGLSGSGVAIDQPQSSDTSNDADADTETAGVDDDSGASDQDSSPSPFDVTDSQSATNNQPSQDGNATRKAGSLSTWLLFVFAMTGGIRRVTGRPTISGDRAPPVC